MSIFSRLLKSRDPAKVRARDIAAQVMSGARQPELFLSGFARDDFDGRFQMVAVHGGLAMRRLKTMDREALVVSEKLGEVLFDRFDYAYREEGVGDSSIARKVRKLGEQYFGLVRAMDGALDGGEVALEDVLQRNGLGGLKQVALADYIRRADQALAATPDDAVLSGRFQWPQIT